MSLKRAKVSLLLSLALSLLSASCSAPRGEEVQEFARLTHLIGKVRAAENSQKLGFLQRLHASSCSRYCRLRSVCLSAYEGHQKALLEIERARQMARNSASDPATSLLLTRAQKELESAFTETKQCAELEADLSRALSKR